MRSWLRARKADCPAAPAFPDGLTVYAVGDVHGRVDCLLRAQEAIDRDGARLAPDQRKREIYLGDYIDRGPNSRGVLDNLIARARLREVVALLGNHEMMMMSFLKGETSFADWRKLGGLETMMSYGLDAQRLSSPAPLRPAELAPLVPDDHLAFLSSLPLLHLEPPYCFVHAGLRPGVALERQSPRDLTWIRDEFLEWRKPLGHVVVHGHTPVREIEFHANRINIDTGAYLTNRLSVLRIDNEGPMALISAKQQLAEIR